MSEVLVYSTPSCRYCLLAKQYFKQHEVEFKDLDVSRDQEAAQEMVAKSGQMGVPVVQIGDSLVIGFQPKLFGQLLRGEQPADDSEIDSFI